MSLLFYQLVGTGEQRRRNRNAKRLGCSEIDDKLILRSLLYREVGRLRAFKYFVYFLCMCRRGTERTSRRDPQDGYQGGAASYPHNELGLRLRCYMAGDRLRRLWPPQGQGTGGRAGARAEAGRRRVRWDDAT